MHLSSLLLHYCFQSFGYLNHFSISPCTAQLKRLKHHMELDWGSLVQRFNYDKYYHLVIFPFYKEPREVLEGTLQGLADSKYDLKKLLSS